MASRLVLRPQVGMRQYVGIPYVVALGLCDALPNVGIAWPHDVVSVESRELVSSVRTRGGYDDEGMFAQVDLMAGPEVHEAVVARVESWAKGTKAAPLAGILDEYARRLVQLNETVRVLYPNGAERTRGVFVGIDVWGRATVRLASGELLEFPPEKYRIA